MTAPGEVGEAIGPWLKPRDLLLDLARFGVMFRVGPDLRGRRKLYMADAAGAAGGRARAALEYWHDDLVALVGEAQVIGRGESWPLQVPDWLAPEPGKSGLRFYRYPRLNGTIAHFWIRRSGMPELIHD